MNVRLSVGILMMQPNGSRVNIRPLSLYGGCISICFGNWRTKTKMHMGKMVNLTSIARFGPSKAEKKG